MLRRSTALALALAVLAAGSAALGADSSAAVRVGFGEQNATVFDDPRFRSLGIKRMRIFVPWNVARAAGPRADLKRWLRAAKRRRVQPLVTFTATANSRCPKRPCRLPRVGAYRKAFRIFRKRFRRVRVISPWNEANHRSQPTFKRPRRAAQYYNVVRRHCRRCTIVAADVIDERNMVRWLRKFRRFAKKPRIWGLHNYRDTNRRKGQRLGGTRRLLRAVRGKVWLTETGGIVKFVLPSGGTLFPYNERRANRAVRRMFRLAKRYRKRIKRLYIYHWQQSPHDNRFDAGVIRRDGSARPAYSTVRRHLRGRFFAR